MSGYQYLQNINGLIGLPGTGKSLCALKIALHWCNKYKFGLCMNFSINKKALYDYCCYKGYYYIIHLLINNEIKSRKIIENNKLILDKFMREEKTLYIFDEAGVTANAREFRNTPKEFLVSLPQIRHDRRILIYCAQYHDMVDKTLRELTGTYIHCNSKTKFNKEKGVQEIVIFNYSIFNSINYKKFLNKVQTGTSGIKTILNQRKLSDYNYSWKLSKEDLMIFKIYESYGGRIENFKKEPNKFINYRNSHIKVMN